MANDTPSTRTHLKKTIYGAMIFSILNVMVWNMDNHSLLVIIDGVYSEGTEQITISALDIVVSMGLEIYWMMQIENYIQIMDSPFRTIMVWNKQPTFR